MLFLGSRSPHAKAARGAIGGPLRVAGADWPASEGEGRVMSTRPSPIQSVRRKPARSDQRRPDCYESRAYAAQHPDGPCYTTLLTQPYHMP
jgi:hypothetical protein